MISVSKEAAQKFEEIKLKAKNPEKTMLRVAFGGFGWGGPSLQLTLDELTNNEDTIVESQGIKVIYESDLEAYLNNSVIDYSNKWFERGFHIKGAMTSSC